MKPLVVIALMVLLAVGGILVTLVVPGPLHYWGTALLFIVLFIATVVFMHRKKAGNKLR